MITASNQLNELELIEKAKLGDKNALTELVKIYEQTVYNFSFKICRDKERAEHTMQETFLSMVRNLTQFSGNSKLSTWLYTVVTNHCLMLARSKKNKNTDIIDDASISNNIKTTEWRNDPESIVENNELKEVLDEAIKKLPYEYRIVFLLRDVEGFSTEETSKMTELSIPAVKSRLHRARGFLRNEINKVFEDGK